MARSQKGQAIVLIAVMLAVVVGMVALAIDGARAYSLRRDLQSAVDSAALAAGDKMQQSGSYPSAEQAASTIFGTNLRLYTAPPCLPGYGTPGASSYTVTCTFSDGTTLTDVATALGPQGSAFRLTATRSLQLTFGRILTSGGNPPISATASSESGNLRYSPALAALAQDGCGGASGNAISVSGSGTLNLVGDMVANGTVAVTAGSVRVAGDIDARCQAPVPGSVANACFPSGASSPCSYPDVAGATRSGFQLAAPDFSAPAATGTQALPTSNVVVPPGIYAAAPVLNGDHCWFLSGGVYEFLAGATNSGDLVSNELKPPDEPDPTSITSRSLNQFWDRDGVRCSGSVDVNAVGGPRGIPVGNWAFEVTSTRTDTYGGVSYTRESAPSMCYSQNVNNSGENIQIAVSNVPGATAYNIYASPPGAGGTCNSPLGFVTSLSVTGSVQNTNTTPCPVPVGGGCSLGNESMRLDSTLLSPTFTPNVSALPDTTGAYPPDGERAPLAPGLPNQNPARGAGAAGDRANENNCKTTGNVFATCPSAITPGAVELYFPPGGCLSTGNNGDTYLFSGYQYDWVVVYEPPSNNCANTLGANGNTAYIGLFFAPSASVAVSSPYVSEAPGVGGIVVGSASFTGALPSITYNPAYAPVPPASFLTG